MTWSDQTDSMMKVWTEAQKKMWENWYQMSQNMANPSALSGFGIYDQWQAMASKWIESVNGNMEPAAQNLSRQFVASQSTMMRFLEMTTKAWSIMMPRLEAGENWDKVLNDYMEQFRKQMFDPAQMMQAAQGSATMWGNYMQAYQTAMLPWMKPMQQAPGMFGTAMMSQNSGTNIMDLTRMFWDAYDQTAGQMVGVPGVGFTRELEEKISRAYKAWQKSRKAMDEYQLLMSDGWSGVMEQVLREMMNRAEKGQPIESIRDLIRLWTGAADKSFDKVFRSERYSEVQGAFLSTYMEYRIEEQKVFEEFMKYSYIPTRSEMDEAHRNIYELRKEVKMLKKAMGETAGKKKVAAPAPKKPAADPAKKPADAPKPADPSKPESSAN
jgi:class III poly(R)-hydroxyalkanoic acid synthase PhaE subunit